MPISYTDLPAFFLAIGALYYLWAIVFKGAEPLVGTWFVYTVLTGLTAYGMYESGSLSRMVIVAIIFDVLILALAVCYRGKWSWSAVDRWCFGTAAIGGSASIMATSPALAIATGVLATTAAAIPTAVKALHEPDSESAEAYICFIWSSGFAIMQLPSWAFEHSFQPIMWFINGAFTYVIIMLSPETRGRLLCWSTKLPT
ncbi:hypothetical protein K2Q16_03860 [Patescibacteria group bacterium]|nr:hypothetical protein [Patescibacteria group bacterium]